VGGVVGRVLAVLGSGGPVLARCLLGCVEWWSVPGLPGVPGDRTRPACPRPAQGEWAQGLSGCSSVKFPAPTACCSDLLRDKVVDVVASASCAGGFE
jgi:hypothetical protein